MLFRSFLPVGQAEDMDLGGGSMGREEAAGADRLVIRMGTDHQKTSTDRSLQNLGPPGSLETFAANPVLLGVIHRKPGPNVPQKSGVTHQIGPPSPGMKFHLEFKIKILSSLSADSFSKLKCRLF